MVVLDLILRSLRNSWNTLDVNWESLSLIIDSSSPNLWYTLSIKSFAIPDSFVVFLVGIMTTPFVSLWSTTDRMVSCSLLLGRSVIKSQDIFANGCIDVAALTGFNVGLDGCLLILYCWHVAQPLQ